MKHRSHRIHVGLFCALGLSSCGFFFSGPHHPFGKGDYAIRLAQPYATEVALGRKRLSNFVRRADTQQLARLARQPIVAVQANLLNVAAVPWLSHKLATGKIQSVEYDSSRGNSAPDVGVKFLVLFDSRTGRLVSSDGVLVIDTPQRGSIARFAGISAIYAGTGWW